VTGGLPFFTIPPAKIIDFGHLPLHKGGSRFALHLTDKLKFEIRKDRKGALHLRSAPLIFTLRIPQPWFPG
jgi:hypothetical protein